jgi:uncharacterized protein (TIGR00251 family)
MPGSVQLSPTSNGVRLHLRVKPGGRRNRLVAAYGEALKLEVQAPPERGKANAAVVKLLSDQLGVPAAAIQVIAGVTSQSKVVEVSGVTVDEMAERFDRLGIAASEGVPGNR